MSLEVLGADPFLAYSFGVTAGMDLAQFTPDIVGTYWLAAPSPKLLKKQHVVFIL
jgi:hypothetical protein